MTSVTSDKTIATSSQCICVCACVRAC